MNRKRLFVIGLLAIAVAGYVTFAVYRFVTNSLGASGSKTNVVVASVDLAAGASITAPDIRVVQMPATELPAGTFSKPEELIGRGVVESMTKNEIVLARKIAAPGSGAGLPPMIPAGMRAVSVKVNEVVSVAGFVLPGTRVDVLMTGYPDRDRDPKDVTTVTVLENVLVLAAGPQLERDKNGQPQQVPVITLLVSPDEAQRLTLAASEGRIQLSLRNPLDQDKAKPPVLKNAVLFAGDRSAPAPAVRRPAKIIQAATAPSTPAPTVFQIETIKGDKRDVVKVQ